jgi:predicted acetyltransferase
MQVRPLREEEKETFAKMVRDAFVTGESFVAEFTGRIILEDTRGLFDDEGRLVSGLRLIWNDLWLGQKKVRMAGITNVATPPEYRRKGLLKQLLREVMRQEHAKGFNLSGLYPFEFPFYRKFGYELASSLQRVTVKIPALAAFKSQTPGRWNQCTEEDWPRFNAVYEQYCVGRFGRLERPKDNFWRRSIFTAYDHGAYIPLTAYVWTDEAGQDRAYIIYRMKAKEGSEWDRDMRIREMVWLDEVARHEIYAFIANHDSQAERAIWNTEPGDEVYALLSDPRAATLEHEAGFMLRLLDVEKALTERAWPALESGETAGFSLAVRDDVLEWNDRRTYHLQAKGGQVEVSSRPGMEQAGLSCDVRSLAQLYAGYLSPLEAARLGNLEVRSEAELAAAQRLFSPPGQPSAFMNDWW